MKYNYSLPILFYLFAATTKYYKSIKVKLKFYDTVSFTTYWQNKH